MPAVSSNTPTSALVMLSIPARSPLERTTASDMKGRGGCDVLQSLSQIAFAQRGVRIADPRTFGCSGIATSIVGHAREQVQ